jgi:hypothetical protein
VHRPIGGPSRRDLRPSWYVHAAMARVPDSLVVTTGAYRMDGGSIYLALRGPDGSAHTLNLWQHGLSGNFSAARPPGALVFDGEVLVPRGADEVALLAALRAADLEPTPVAGGTRLSPRRIVLGDDIKHYTDASDRGPDAALRMLVDRVVSFVESEEYVEVAKRHGRL